MTPDAFRRFLLLLACTAYVVGLGVVWILLGWILALVAGVLGPALALFLTLEPTPPKEERAGADEPEGLSRLEIRRRARGQG